FQQTPATLLPAPTVRRGEPAPKGPLERKFTAKVVLNRGSENHVEIELPGLKQRTANMREFVLDCQAPDPVRRWNVVPIVACQPQNLRADAKKPEEPLRTLLPPKAEIKVTPPLVRDVDPGKMIRDLQSVLEFMEQTAEGGSTNEAVVFYYQGGEAIND